MNSFFLAWKPRQLCHWSNPLSHKAFFSIILRIRSPLHSPFTKGPREPIENCYLDRLLLQFYASYDWPLPFRFSFFFFFFILIRNFQIWHTFTVTLEYLRLMYKYIRMLLRNYNCCRNYVNWYSNSKPFKCTRAPLFMYIYIHRYVIPRGPNLNANSRSTDSWFLVSLMPHLGVGVIKMRA